MYQYKAKLIRVVDGDTVDAMIDCGFSTFKKDKKEKEKGFAAKARLEELLGEGNNEFIVETSIDKKGKYGRLLGKLFRIKDSEHQALASTNKSYNEILLNEGHATEYFGGKK